MADHIVHPSRVHNYLDYNAVTEYERVEGTLLLPTVDGAPVAIETHEPYRLKKVSYSGKGRGEPTVMPRPADTATVLSHSHVVRDATPFSGGEGNGFIYSCAGTYTVVEGAAGLLSNATYDLPAMPFKLAPMATEARNAGYGYYPGELVSGTPREYDPASATAVWPQSLTITSNCFSDQLA